MKNFIPFLLLLLLIVGGKKEHDDNSDPIKISIITTADLQSQVVPEMKEINNQNISVGGLARIAQLSSDIRQESDYSLLLSSGDDMIGAFYEFVLGKPEMQGMSMTGYDVATPGNHEFDYGADHYKGALSYANFDFVSSNLEFTDPELASLFKPFVIKNLGEIKVGIFGLMTPDFPLITSAGPGVTVDQDFIGIAKNMINSLKEENCDIIVALTHLGSELDVELAQKVNDIDIIVGGHSHDIFYDVVDQGNGKKTIIVNDGVRATYLGLLELTYNDGAISTHSWQTILLDSTITSDPEIKQLMEDYMEDYQDSTGVVIGNTLVDLDGRESSVRMKESNLGNLICDAWIDWFSDVDISIINGGSIRGNKIYPQGPVTYNNLLEILPFYNDVYKVKLSGSELRQVLEISASALHIAGDGCPVGERPGTGGFLQIGGMKIVIDTTGQPFCAKYDGHNIQEIINAGSRLVSAQVLQNGNWIQLDTTATYTCLANEWLVGGGDGYYIFLEPDVNITNSTMLDIDLLTSYLKKNTPVSPQTDGRIGFSE